MYTGPLYPSHQGALSSNACNASASTPSGLSTSFKSTNRQFIKTGDPSDTDAILLSTSHYFSGRSYIFCKGSTAFVQLLSPGLEVTHFSCAWQSFTSGSTALSSGYTGNLRKAMSHLSPFIWTPTQRTPSRCRHVSAKCAPARIVEIIAPR